MTGHQSLEFLNQLRQAGYLRNSPQGTGELGASELPADTQRGLAWHEKLWEITDLSPSEFADEAARFFNHERVTLQEMLQAAPLVGSFSQRFLRESLVFPYQSPEGGPVLAIADPTDLAAIRAAEI